MGRITKDDQCLIMGLRTEKKWGAKRLISEFPNKRWSQSSLTLLLRKIDNYGTTERKSGSGRRRSVRTAVNISTVDDMISERFIDSSINEWRRRLECVVRNDG